ncbi:MAG: LacI family DNA-binding transcriptional regulator [Candidatus Marinimicrobia bacterium]|nr:LacI family DNA-binding transcriptional regulator [Candidatus Neomarinimicrobiota bacterium]
MVPTVTLQTIADIVGVSRSTVSRVLSDQQNHHRISARTAKSITLTAKELNYIKNEGARSLRVKKTSTIGVIVRDITNPFYAQLVKHIDNALYQEGYTVIISSTGYDLAKERGHISFLLSRKVDGIILSPIQKSYENVLLVKEHDLPLVLFDCKIDEIESDYVVVSNEASSANGVNHLTSLGHRKIAYIGGDQDDSNNRLRFAGYKKALTHAAIPISEKYVRHGSYTFRHGFSAAKELMHLEDTPTAIFVANNRIVLGTYKGILDSSKRIPGDVSIVGFDDFETAAMLASPLTVIRQPLEEMAAIAVDLLLTKIKSGNRPPYVVNKLDTELIFRGSTGPVN